MKQMTVGFLIVSSLVFSWVLAVGQQNAAEIPWWTILQKPTVTMSDLKTAGIKMKEYSACASIRFGGGSNDILHTVFECEEKLRPHDKAYLQIPGHSTYGNPVRRSGKEDGESGIEKFPSISVVGNYGDIEHKCKLEVAAESDWDDREVDICVRADCRLRNGATRESASFTLLGEFSVDMDNSSEPCEVVLISNPRLKARWDHRSEPPHVRASIRMGRLALIPGSGMDSKASISVVNVLDSKSVISRRIKMEPSETTGEFLYHSKKRLKKGAEYRMTMNVDLSPFFGTTTCSDVTALPK